MHRVMQSRWMGYLFATLVLALLVAGVYSQALSNGFHFDDHDNILNIPEMHLETLSLAGLQQAVESSLLQNRPIPNLSFAIDWWRGGGDSRSFQATNISIHLLNSVLVFALLLLLGRQFQHPFKLYFALLGAAIWAVHPIQIQGVTYIVQRMASLATLFTLLSLCAYLCGRFAQRWNGLWFILSGGSFLLAALCKEIAWITPLLILLFEYGVVRHNQPLIQYRFDRIVLAIPVLLAVWVIIDLVSGAGPLSQRFLPEYRIRDFTLEQRLLTQPQVVLFYISQYLFPLSERFSIEHDVVIAKGLFNPLSTLFALLAVLAWCGIGLWLLLKKQTRLWGALILWLPITLMIESSAVALEMIFEHRMYLPSFGLVALLALTMMALTTLTWQRYAGLIFMGLFVLFCSYSSVQRIPAWQSSFTLYQSAVDNAPNSARLWGNLALEYLAHQQPEKGEQAASRALKLDARSIGGMEAMGVIMMARGNLMEAERLLGRAMRISEPPSHNLLNHYGEVKFKQRQYGQAQVLFARAIEASPYYVNYYWNHALALEGLGECQRAHQNWQQFIRRSEIAADIAEVQQHLLEHYQQAGGKCVSR